MRHGLTDCGKEVLRSCREEGSPLPHKIRQTFGVRDGALGILVRSTLVVLVPWSPSTSRTGSMSEWKTPLKVTLSECRCYAICLEENQSLGLILEINKAEAKGSLYNWLVKH